MNYHYARLSACDFGLFRSPGPGLGNLLMPIARALVGRERHGGVFVHPTLRQIKFGTFFRREGDKRTYGDLIRGRSGEEWSAWLAARRAPQIAEERARNERSGAITIVYEGLGRHFHDFADHRASIDGWLQSVVVDPKPLPEPYPIAAHVRFGDFVSHTETTASGRNIRNSIRWYRSAIDRAAEIAGAREMRLFTDVDAEALRSELGVDDCAIDRSPNALEAIRAMSRAEVIVTSRSSFSMWAAFLGRSRAIWNRELDLGAVFPVRDGLDTFM